MKRSLILMSVILTGCAAHRGSAPQATAAPARSNDPVIVKLVGRDTTLVARASRHGTTYSMESNTGEVIVPSQTLETLRVQRPALANEVQTLQASAWAGL